MDCATWPSEAFAIVGRPPTIVDCLDTLLPPDVRLQAHTPGHWQITGSHKDPVEAVRRPRSNGYEIQAPMHAYILLPGPEFVNRHPVPTPTQPTNQSLSRSQKL